MTLLVIWQTRAMRGEDVDSLPPNAGGFSGRANLPT